jgi:hypothetical protein
VGRLLRGCIFESVAAGVWSNEFRVGPGVFAAVGGSEKIEFADGVILFVKGQPGTDIGQLAAGPAADTFAPPVFRDGQYAG